MASMAIGGISASSPDAMETNALELDALAMNVSATQMYQEADEIPQRIGQQHSRNAALVARIVAHLKGISPNFIVTCARGSSDHAATYAKYLFETRMGLACCSFAPSVASVYAAQTHLQGAVCIAISQSGRSPDILSACEAAKAGGAYLLAIVNDEASPLASLADDVLPISVGAEISVPATKSCIGAMSALYHLCAKWCGHNNACDALAHLPETLAEAWLQDWSHAFALMREARQALVLGRGIGLAGAQEAALKLKETCTIQAEGFSAAEVRHGPLSMIDKGFPVLAIASFDASQRSIDSVSKELLECGARVFVAGEPVEGTICLPTPRAGQADLQPLVFLQSFYKFANALSLYRGLDPDRPRNLSKVTKTL